MNYITCLKISIVATLLNIALALILSPFATPSQIKPPNGAAKLDFFSQIMHMLVHHGQVLFTSSLIIFVLTFLACAISNMIFK